MLFSAIYVVLATLATSVFAAPHTSTPHHHLKRAPAQVITSCSVPNTAALTFVSHFPFLGIKRPRF